MSVKYFLYLYLLSKSQITTAQEHVITYVLSPSIMNTTDAPYLTADIQAQRDVSRTGWSICSWITLAYFRRPSVIFSVMDAESSQWEISLGIHPTSLLLKYKDSNFVIANKNLIYLPLEKNHFCMSITSTSLAVYHNGEIVHSSNFPGIDLLKRNLKLFVGGGEHWPEMVPKTVDMPVIKMNNFVLSSSPKGSFSGTITEPSIWNADLIREEIQRLSRCEVISQPSTAVSWTIKGSNIVERRADKRESCSGRKYDYLFLSKALTFEENNLACQKLQLNLIAPNENEDYVRLIDDAKLYYDTCGKGDWYAWLRPVMNILDPVSQISDGCDVLTMTGLEKISCEESLCSGCQLEYQKKLFVLRGICTLDKIDLSFILKKNSPNIGFSFHGIERYSISEAEDSWLLNDDATGASIASIKSSITPVGVQEWKIHRDICGKMKDQIVRATLSACNSEEAVCSDGLCIPISKRCDSYPDCLDASDEIECKNIRPSNAFDFATPPLPVAKVWVTINIIQIVSTPPEKPFTILFGTNFKWSDSRLKLANIKPNTKHHLKNAKLWRPKLSVISLAKFASNEVENEEISSIHTFDFVNKEGSTLSAKTRSSPLPDMRDTTLKDALYAGENTTLSLDELTTQDIDCDFDFTFFPFDEHICQISLVFAAWPSSRLMLKNPIYGRYTGPMKLPHYTMMTTKVERKNVKLDGKLHDGVVLILHLSHRNSLLVISMYLPTFILLIVNSSTLWMMGLQGIFARVQISCIILIVVMMDWHLMVKYAPQTGYLMANDAWICFCAIFAILHLSVHVLLDIFNDDHQPDPFSRIPSRISSSRIRDVKPVDTNSLYDGILLKVAQMESAKFWSIPYWILFIARVVSPVLLIFFNGAYWPFVLYFSKKDPNY